MEYKKLAEVYEEIESTTKGLEKTKIISAFLTEIKDTPEFIYLLQGKVFADYDSRDLGISEQIMIKAISTALGVPTKEVVSEFKNLGDLGKVAESLASDKKQDILFSKELSVEKVILNLRKISELEGKGTVDKKIGLVVELLNSASDKEAKYLTRTVLGDLKVGVGNGILRDSIVDICFNPGEDLEMKKKHREIVQEAFDKVTDVAEVFEKAITKKLETITLSPGKPVKVMLFPKAKDVEDAFRIIGKPAAFEYKYDGFRMMINKDKKGEIKIFTRRLEEVTKQFPEIISYVQKNVKSDSFILDAEAVGFDQKTKKYIPFQYISQRIRRKYEIERMAKDFPVELRVFDIVFHDNKSLISKPFGERRKILEKIIKEKDWQIKLAEQIITDNEKEVEKFYEKALEDGQEGLMGKNLEAIYKPGARIGYAVKLKPEDKDLDLVITGAEWGTGKRAGWLTSFDVSCLDKNGELKEIGKVSTGVKELADNGLSYKEMTDILQKLSTSEKEKKISVKPKTVVTVQYQNIQKSPTYSSGYALRFPRIKALRPDRNKDDIATLKDVEEVVE